MYKNLYRAKLKSGPRAGEWVYWNIYGELCTENGKRHSLKIKTSHGERLYYEVIQIEDKLDKSTIGASTGMYADDTKQIFTGDIVGFEGNINKFYVEWGTFGGIHNVNGEVGYPGFGFKPADDWTSEGVRNGWVRDDPVYWIEKYGVKILGNIYEGGARE